jgi:hypothetical protein
VTIALLGVILAAALPAVAALAGTPELAAALLAEQLAFGWAWVAVLRASWPTVLLLAAAAVAADGAVLGATRHDLGSLAGVVGSGLAVVIVYQLVRRRRLGAQPAQPSPAPAGSTASAGAAAPAGPVVTAGSVASGEPAVSNGSAGAVAPADAAVVGAGAPGAAGAGGAPPADGPAQARVTAELAAALGGGTLVAFLAGLLALRAQPGTPAPAEGLVVVGLAGAAGAVLAAWLSGLLGAGPLVAGVLGTAVGTALGAGYGGLTDELSAGAAALLAATGALAAAVTGVLIARVGRACAAAAGAPPVAAGSTRDADGPVAGTSPGAPPTAFAGRRAGPAGLETGALAPAVLLTATGARLRPFGAKAVAAALLAAVAPLTVAAPLVYLVGRHLPG